MHCSLSIAEEITRDLITLMPVKHRAGCMLEYDDSVHSLGLPLSALSLILFYPSLDALGAGALDVDYSTLSQRPHASTLHMIRSGRITAIACLVYNCRLHREHRARILLEWLSCCYLAIAPDGFIATLRRALCVAKAPALGEILLMVLLCFVVILQVLHLCPDGHGCLHKQSDINKRYHACSLGCGTCMVKSFRSLAIPQGGLLNSCEQVLKLKKGGSHIITQMWHIALPAAVKPRACAHGAYLRILHLGDDLQISLGGLCDVPLLCIVSIDARSVLRASVVALPILCAGVYLPPEHLEQLLICDQRRVIRDLQQCLIRLHVDGEGYHSGQSRHQSLMLMQWQ